MGLATGNQTDRPLAQSLAHDGPQLIHHENVIHHEHNRAVFENVSSPGQDYLEIVARATNDAIRDWDIGSGALSWPQGLEKLLGYSDPGQSLDLRFWQERIHPADNARIAASMRRLSQARAIIGAASIASCGPTKLTSRFWSGP